MGGGAGDMKSMWPPLMAVFFMTFFTGGHGDLMFVGVNYLMKYTHSSKGHSS